MKTLKYLVLALALGAPARAQSLAVQFQFAGVGVSAGAVTPVATAAPQQFTNPEESGLFVEVLDAEGGVTYAAAVVDPRGTCAGPVGGDTVAPTTSAAVEVVVPAADAAKVVLWRRTSDDPDTGRTALVRVSL